MKKNRVTKNAAGPIKIHTLSDRRIRLQWSLVLGLKSIVINLLKLGFLSIYLYWTNREKGKEQ